MRCVPVAAAAVENEVLRAELSDGRIVHVVFDEYGIPHAGRKLTTATREGYIVEMILPYDVRVLRKIDA